MRPSCGWSTISGAGWPSPAAANPTFDVDVFRVPGDVLTTSLLDGFELSIGALFADLN